MTKASSLGGNYYRLFAASTLSNLGDGVGLVAYPWLASAVTRNGVLIALIVVVQRLPWLLLSLPAGVITDRYSRQLLMTGANAARAAITMVVAAGVWMRQSDLASPDELGAGVQITDDHLLYGLILVATFLLGSAEVLYDNAAQTFLPRIVHSGDLERANGRLWSAEQVANTFIGPPLGAGLLVVAFALPFGVDAITFGISAALVALIRTVEPTAKTTKQPDGGGHSWRTELADGFRWLWRNDLLRSLAIILGFFNMLGTVSASTMVLFAQEVLDTSPTEFAILQTGGAIGGIAAGMIAPRVAQALGSGPSLWLALAGGAVTALVVGFTSWWPLVWLAFLFFMFLAVLWNVITVSLRQEVIPDGLLGRVNSVYRFFAWGSMPLGAFVGGVIIAVTERLGGREWALRMPWIIAGIGHLPLLAYAVPRLTTAKMDALRQQARQVTNQP